MPRESRFGLWSHSRAQSRDINDLGPNVLKHIAIAIEDFVSNDEIDRPETGCRDVEVDAAARILTSKQVNCGVPDPDARQLIFGMRRRIKAVVGVNMTHAPDRRSVVVEEDLDLEIVVLVIDDVVIAKRAGGLKHLIGTAQIG